MLLFSFVRLLSSHYRIIFSPLSLLLLSSLPSHRFLFSHLPHVAFCSSPSLLFQPDLHLNTNDLPLSITPSCPLSLLPPSFILFLRFSLFPLFFIHRFSLAQKLFLPIHIFLPKTVIFSVLFPLLFLPPFPFQLFLFTLLSYFFPHPSPRHLQLPSSPHYLCPKTPSTPSPLSSISPPHSNHLRYLYEYHTALDPTLKHTKTIKD